MDLPDWLPAWLLVLVFNFVFQLTGFSLAWTLKSERFYDFFGATNFILVATITWLISDEVVDARRISATLLFSASRAWLLVFLSIRACERGDARFDEVKQNCGVFLVYWLVQALWVFLVSLPCIAINSAEGVTPDLGVLGICCLLLFAASLMTQIHSDWIKLLWVREGRPGSFCRRGCWKFSRHPNYCGEIAMGLCIVGLTIPLMYRDDEVDALAVVSILSPIFTFMILMFVSGMPTAEGAALKRYYEKVPKEYHAYRARTPILVPWPCPGYDRVPSAAKCLCCCEWGMYALPEDVRTELEKNVDSVPPDQVGGPP
jgi:steroid 5-alpha reductase family enzyme